MPPSGDAPCSDIASHAVPARGYDGEAPDGGDCLETAAGGLGGAGMGTCLAQFAGAGGGGMGVVGVGVCAGGAGLPKIARQMPLPKPPPAAGVAGAAGCCCLAAAAGAEAGRALDAAAEEEEDGEGVLGGPSSIEADAVEPLGFMKLPNMDSTLVAWSRQEAQWQELWV